MTSKSLLRSLIAVSFLASGSAFAQPTNAFCAANCDMTDTPAAETVAPAKVDLCTYQPVREAAAMERKLQPIKEAVDIVQNPTGFAIKMVDKHIVHIPVWVGYANPPREMRTEYKGDPVMGGTFPAELWKRFMLPAHAHLPVEDWPGPAGVYSVAVNVDRRFGTSKLAPAGCPYARQLVLAADHAPTQQSTCSRTLIPVPDLSGMDKQEAFRHAEQAYSLAKTASWAWRMLFDAKLEQTDWTGALALAQGAIDRKIVAPVVAERARAALLAASAASLETNGDPRRQHEAKLAECAHGFLLAVELPVWCHHRNARERGQAPPDPVSPRPESARGAILRKSAPLAALASRRSGDRPILRPVGRITP